VVAVGIQSLERRKIEPAHLGGISVRLPEWPSSGREPYVFKVDKPQDLPGFHAELIESTLRHDEKLYYLLYSPIWYGSETPFGARTFPASHAVAVTENRFIISEDRHIRGIEPTIQSTSFDRILTIELGNALIMGWFVIRFAGTDGISSTSLLYTATGQEHFETVVRQYRRMIKLRWNREELKAIRWKDVWLNTQRIQRDMLKSIVLERELPLLAVRSSEVWGGIKRRWKKRPVCLAAEGILIFTNLGILYAVDEPPIRPEILSFGVNLTCVPFEAMKGAVLFEKTIHGNRFYLLSLEIGRDLVSFDLEVPFNKDSYEAASNLVCYVTQDVPAGRCECIL
jgi:hypothetical protein